LANTSTARKCVRKAERHRQHNIALVSRFRTAIKDVVKAIDKGDRAAAEAAYGRAVPLIDSTADKGFAHKNKAARHKSRLNAMIRKLAPSS
jgi:small subunit ribosomal protein S20